MKKRVLIYGINYAPEIAGVGRYTGEIGEHLASLGHEVCVVTAPPHYPGWKARPSYSARAWTREEVAGATVYRCPLYLHSRMRGFRRLLAPLSFALSSAPIALFQILTRRPDVVIAIEPTLFVSPVALFAARLIGAQTVLHVQDLEIDAAFAVGHLGSKGILPRLARAFERAVMHRFDRVITISNRMAEKIREKDVRPDRIEVVRNWVDLDLIRPMKTSQAYRRELGLEAGDFVVLYSGNLGAKQGLGLLLDAARRLKAHQNIVFAIAGDGPMRPEVEAAAAACPNVRIYGFQPEARFGEFLSVADVHVLPQERDAADLLLPSKLGGMLASSRPIIATAEAGTELADFLGDSCQLTPPGDAAALAAAILAALTEEPSRQHQAGRLSRAATLSKAKVIKTFTTAALFLHLAPQTNESACKAA